ncbi:hypothetical protein [Pseudomonas gingeri]|uniref:hypothetical protein n=1 Tax=Pseudomonas gingeri TaxID=117681 RepID=UPI0015A0D4D3|nr:hypothetical protein [Pseudomonas gingeri]NVZ73784.1 hypothetical protein [Pseudomonas gingeri]NWA03749.1 hypothetical protein [Pseudomonas gingeri]NWA14608.1 hypothetical protein [Pseudomonas gingeri]NWA58736.1 hypothetical protein [Pseudomonas gingeri]NWA94498.1 hypothetical protein [Pseudomonas gingeri]
MSDQAADCGAQQDYEDEDQAGGGRGNADGAAPGALAGGHGDRCDWARRVGPKAMFQRETWRWCWVASAPG